MTKTSKTTNFYSSVSSVTSVAINYLRKQRNLRLRMNRSTFVEKPLRIHPFLKKQTQFFPLFSPKTTIPPNSNPIQTQFKANLNPIQTQFLALFNHGNTVLISVNQCLNIIRVNSWNLLLKTIPFFAKRTQTFPLSAQKPRFHQKTNPKRTQTKPNGFDAKMNLYPVIIKRYEKIR